MVEFYYPTELGEQLAFGAAAFTALAGLFMMFAPGLTFRALGLQTRDGRSSAYGEARSTMGGFYLGFGLSVLMLRQEIVYLAFGATFALAAFARVLSMMSDRGGIALNLLLLVVQTILAVLPIIYVFKLV